MAIDHVDVCIRVDIPALDNLVSFLREKHGIAEPSPVKAPETVVNDGEATVQEPAEEPAETPVEHVAEPVETKAEPAQKTTDTEEAPWHETPVEPMPEVKDYPADTLARAAVALRDIDPENTAKVKAHFPEFGIRSLGDLKKKSVEERAAFAQILIDLGAEL